MGRHASVSKLSMWLMALVLAAFLAGCGGGGGSASPAPDPASDPGEATPGSGLTAVAPGPAGNPGASTTDPTVGSSNPSNGATNVSTSTNSNNIVAGINNLVTGTLVSATFSQPMDPATINSSPAGTLATFTLKETATGTSVPGTVAMNAAGTIATFAPTAAALAPNTEYTATVTTAAKNAGGTAMANPVAWSFTTGAARTSQAALDLGTAGNFVILSKTGITNVPASAITGDVGTSPITGAANLLSCPEVTGNVYSVDAAGPAPCSVADPSRLTTAVSDMETAYTHAAGRVIPDATDLGAGDISGLTIAPGLYKWTTGVSINSDVTLSGGPNDVWIFQIAGDLTMAAAMKVTLAGGALARNIFWQTFGVANFGTTSQFEGVLLSQTSITLQTGASANSRLLAQTAVVLDQNTVVQPAP